MTFILISGEIGDISVRGPHVAFAGVVLAKLAQAGVPLPAAVVLMVLVLGTADRDPSPGFLRARLDVPRKLHRHAVALAGPSASLARGDVGRRAEVMIMDIGFQRFGSGLAPRAYPSQPSS